MQWWNDIVDWFQSEDGWRITSSAIIPFVAIVLAGVLAAWIGRSATRRLIAQRDRESRIAVVTALITSGQSAAVWHSLTPDAREHAKQLATEAEVRLRLTPIGGSPLAADWASHQLAEMRTNSVSFSYQADQTLDEFEDRLSQWVRRPGRAKKLFGDDLERWRYESPREDPVVLDQQRWAEEQVTAATNAAPERRPDRPLAAPSPATRVPEEAAPPVPQPAQPAPQSADAPAAATGYAAPDPISPAPYTAPPATPAHYYPAPDAGAVPQAPPPTTSPVAITEPPTPAADPYARYAPPTPAEGTPSHDEDR